MMVETLTNDDVTRLLREIVAEQPDKVAKPYYKIGKRPECIVGHFAFKLGGQKALMALRESTSVVHNLFVLEPLGVPASAAEGLLGDFQRFQDQGLSWVASLAEVEKLYPEL